MSTRRWYVGVERRTTKYQAFTTMSEPTEALCPQFGAVIGPFVTRRGAEWCQRHGRGNPHAIDVAAMERLAAREGQE